MTDSDDREDGFYWISLGGLAPEVAQWQAEWSAWLLVGKTQPLSDELCFSLTVLEPCLVPPPQPPPGAAEPPAKPS